MIKNRKARQHGFGFLHILLIIVVLVVGAGFWKNQSRKAAITNAGEVRRSDEAQLEAQLRAKKQDQEKLALDERLKNERDKSSYDKSVASLRAINDKWADAFRLTASTARISLSPQIASLQAIKREAEALILPPCLESARSRMSAGMDLGIEGFMTFMSDTKYGNIRSEPFFDGAKNAFDEYKEQSAACSGEKA